MERHAVALGPGCGGGGAGVFGGGRLGRSADCRRDIFLLHRAHRGLVVSWVSAAAAAVFF